MVGSPSSPDRLVLNAEVGGTWLRKGWNTVDKSLEEERGRLDWVTFNKGTNEWFVSGKTSAEKVLLLCVGCVSKLVPCSAEELLKAQHMIHSLIDYRPSVKGELCAGLTVPTALWRQWAQIRNKSQLLANPLTNGGNQIHFQMFSLFLLGSLMNVCVFFSVL